MSKPKHRKFKADKFVDTFTDHTELLRTFARKFDSSCFPAEEDFTLEAFKELASQAVTSNPEMLEHLYRAYDMSEDSYGHEALCAVITSKGWTVDDSLPVECLAIWLHNQDQDTFNFAYDRMHFNHLEKVTMYRIAPPEGFDPGNGHLGPFSDALRAEFQDEMGSSNVLVRQYTENDCLNIIIYHEKRTEAHLIFKDLPGVVGPLMLRPVKQDLVSFNHATGELQIDASYAREKRTLRKAFAGKFLGNEELFETQEASKVLDLDVIAAPEFSMPVSDPEHVASLTEIKFTLPAETNPMFTIRSENVLTTLQDTGLRQQIHGATVASAKIRIKFGENRRDKKTIHLVASNSITYNASTHKEEVEAYLREWGILLAREPAQIPA